jgi:hypothetical protein
MAFAEGGADGPERSTLEEEHGEGPMVLEDHQRVGVAVAREVDDMTIHPLSGRVGEEADLHPFTGSGRDVEATLHPRRAAMSATRTLATRRSENSANGSRLESGQPRRPRSLRRAVVYSASDG